MSSTHTAGPCYLSSKTSDALSNTQQAEASDLSFVTIDECYVWIVDAGRRIGLISRDAATLEWIAPHRDQEPPKPASIPANYHAPTYQGGRIVLQWWLDDGAGWRVEAGKPLTEPFGVLATHPKSRRPRTTISLGRERGDKLTLIAEHQYEGDSRIVARHIVRLCYDPAVMSYVAEVEAELTAPDPYHAEFCNFYAGGVYDNRAESKRYTATIWQHPDEHLVRWNHNPVSYLTPGMNDRTGRRRIANGGFIGYFTDPYTNPIVQILNASPPATAATCSNLYDEHLICLQPRSAANGLYHWHAAYRFYSLKQAVAESIVADAELIDLDVSPDLVDPILLNTTGDDMVLGRRFLHNPQFPGFLMEQVNDFEVPVPLTSTVVGSMIWATATPHNAVYWDKEVGHSGCRSIRLRGDTEEGVTRTRLAGGPTPHIEAGRTYRLAGWVRCRGVVGTGACIRFDVIGRHSNQPPEAINRTEAVGGDCDWVSVETVFQTPDDAELGWLYLELVGPGEAWFDDLILQQC